MNEYALYHLIENIIVQIDEGYNIGEIMTLQTIFLIYAIYNTYFILTLKFKVS